MLECDLLVRAIPAMTDRDVAESREALDGLEESYRKEDISAWGRLNWAFHRRLYEPARRPRTLAMLQAIHLPNERYIRLHLLLTERRAGASRDHRALLPPTDHRNIHSAQPSLRAHPPDHRNNTRNPVPRHPPTAHI